MKVILNKSVDGLGNEGDVVVVKNGFARNYLFPNRIAKNATKNNIANNIQDIYLIIYLCKSI